MAAVVLGVMPRAVADESSPATPSPLSPPGPGLYLKVLVPSALRMSKLGAGDAVEGTLSRDVYDANHRVFCSGERVQLIVDHLERRSRIRNDHWPWIIKAFTPRHEMYPVFEHAMVAEDVGETPLRVSLVSVSRLRDVKAKAKKNSSGKISVETHDQGELSNLPLKKPAPRTVVLEGFPAEGSVETANRKQDQAPALPVESGIIPAGTHCRILLLTNVSASKNKPGDAVEGRLLEPVLLNSKVLLPAGSLFEGKVVKKTAPRWLSRPGSLALTFTGVTLPSGDRIAIAGALAGAQLDARSHTRIDSEGRLHGERPGKAWMAINLGVTAGISKEADDGAQLLIEAIISSATDASTAGMARIVSSAASGLYLATRRGRDVVLPRFTEVDVALDRPVSLSADVANPDSFIVPGAK